MVKVTSLSDIVSTSAQRTSFDEEKEEKRIFPSAVPHIQNHMVTKNKIHFCLRPGHSHLLDFLATPLVMPPYHYIL
jgi:hypothetical protein